MRPAEIMGEALRNVWAGVTRPLALGGAFAVLVGGLTAFDARIIVDADVRLAQWRATGASVVTIQAQGSIDGAACESLAHVAGIIASGAGRVLGDGQPGQALALPALPLAAPLEFEVTPGFARLIATAASGSATPRAATNESLLGGGVLLSDSLAEAVDRGPGSWLATDRGEALVAGAFATPEDGRAHQLDYAVLAQVPVDGRFDFCWAEVWPPDPFVANLVLSTVAPGVGDDVPVTVGQLNPTLGTFVDARALYTHRATRLAPLVAAILALLLGLGGLRLRRLEIASALHTGVSRRALAAQVTIETVLWAAGGALVVAPGIWFAARAGNPLPAAPVAPLAAVVLLAAMAAAVAGAQVGLALTREEHLFRYFKDR